jgi:ATP/ADP translocase
MSQSQMSVTRTADHTTATIAAFMAAALVGQQVAGKAIRDALFLSTFPVTALPWVMIAAALMSIGAAFVFSRAMSIRSPFRVMAAGLSMSAALYVAEWWLSTAYPRTIAAVVYVHLAVFGPALASGMWSLINERFDPHAAKSLIGRIGLGASAGGVAAGALTSLGAGRVPVHEMLLWLALASVAALASLPFLRSVHGNNDRASADDKGFDAGSAIVALRGASYLRNLAALVALASFTEVVVDYVFKAEASRHVIGGQALVGFFGAFYMALSVLGLVTQAVLPKRLFDRLGLSGSVALHPLATCLGAALALFRPGLGVILVARGASGVLRDSVYRSAYELLYTPLSLAPKRATKVVIDVAADKLGAIVGAALVLAQVAITPARERMLLDIVIAACLAALIVARRLNAGYLSALGESLRAGIADLDPAQVVDIKALSSAAKATHAAPIDARISARGDMAGEIVHEGRTPPRDTLVEAIIGLRASRADRIRKVIRGASPVDIRLVPFVIPLLGRNDLFPDALRFLRAAAPRSTGILVDHLLDAETPSIVRARIPRVLKSVPTPKVLSGLLEALDDPAFMVRHQAAVALANITGRDASLTLSPEAIFVRVLRELKLNEEGAKVLEHAFTLLGLALERQHLRRALQALQTENQRLRGTALEYLENVLPEDIREALWPRIATESARLALRRSRREIELDLLRAMNGLPRRRLGARIRVQREGRSREELSERDN